MQVDCSLDALTALGNTAWEVNDTEDERTPKELRAALLASQTANAELKSKASAEDSAKNKIAEQAAAKQKAEDVKQKNLEAAAKKQVAEEAAKKQAAEEAAKKQVAAEEAAKKQAEEEAAAAAKKKAAAEEAAAKKQAEEEAAVAAKKKAAAAEAAAKKQAEEEAAVAAKKKAKEEAEAAAKKKAAEEEAMVAKVKGEEVAIKVQAAEEEVTAKNKTEEEMAADIKIEMVQRHAVQAKEAVEQRELMAADAIVAEENVKVVPVKAKKPSLGNSSSCDKLIASVTAVAAPTSPVLKSKSCFHCTQSEKSCPKRTYQACEDNTCPRRWCSGCFPEHAGPRCPPCNKLTCEGSCGKCRKALNPGQKSVKKQQPRPRAGGSGSKPRAAKRELPALCEDSPQYPETESVRKSRRSVQRISYREIPESQIYKVEEQSDNFSPDSVPAPLDRSMVCNNMLSDLELRNTLCFHCQQPCFFSGVVSTCSREQIVSCLAHASQMCKCKPPFECRRCLFWESTMALDQFMDRNGFSRKDRLNSLMDRTMLASMSKPGSSRVRTNSGEL